MHKILFILCISLSQEGNAIPVPPTAAPSILVIKPSIFPDSNGTRHAMQFADHRDWQRNQLLKEAGLSADPLDPLIEWRVGQRSTNDTNYCISRFNGVLQTDLFTISPSGNVGIGTVNGGTYKLAVEGTIGAHKLRVTVSGWADYVFAPEYRLPTLEEVEAFIRSNRHLPGVPAANEVEKNGLDVGENQAVLLKKIEELTLYMIGLKKENEKLRQRVEKLEADKK